MIDNTPTKQGAEIHTDGPVLDGSSLLVDPRLLYWAALDDQPRRVSDEALRYAFEPHLPATLDEIACRFTWIKGEQSWLACGVDSSRLQRWIDRHEANGDRVESVRPAGLPDVLKKEPMRSSAGDPLRGLEFRTKAFESPRSARRRTLMTAAAILTIVTTSALVTTGFSRRATAADTRTDSLRLQAITLADMTLESAGVTRSPNIDPRLALAAEHLRLEQTRNTSAGGQTAEDRGRTLTALLTSWPDDIPTVVDRIQLEQDSITIQGAVRDAGEFEAMSLRLANFSPTWIKRSSSASKARHGYTFTIQFGVSSLSSSGGAP